MHLFSLRYSPAIGAGGNRCDCFDRTLIAWVTSHTGDVCDASDRRTGPTRLMARAESLAGAPGISRLRIVLSNSSPAP